MTAKQIVNRLLEDYDPDLAEISPEEVAAKSDEFSDEEIKEAVDSLLATALFLAPEDAPEEIRNGSIYMFASSVIADETADVTQLLNDNAGLIRSSNESLGAIGQAFWCSQNGCGGGFSELDGLEELEGYVERNFRHSGRQIFLSEDDGKLYLE